MNEPVRLAVVGTGNRGRYSYGRWCSTRPDLARVVAIAEPDEARRRGMADEHDIPPDRQHTSWTALLDDLSDVDGVVVATLDHHHVEPAVALLAADHDVLLEKPIAPDRAGIDLVRAAARRSNGTISISHVLRYTPVFSTLKRLLDDGVIGTLRGISHAEHVGFRLFTHAYVRGNWRREDLSSPAILSKCCHDLDLIRWWADSSWTATASSGELSYFRPEHAPAGAPDRCLDGCPVEDTCAFHAGRHYIDNNPDLDRHPVTVIINDRTEAGRLDALRNGPYGRCVFRCDNDVPDHQDAMFTFANGVRATFTMTAFTAEGARHTRLFGTHGDMTADPRQGTITLRRYRPAPQTLRPSGTAGGPQPAVQTDPENARAYVTTDIIDVKPDPEAFPGHGGGDDGLMRAFVEHVRQRRDPTRRPERMTTSLTSLEASLDSHEMAFAAERSRHSGHIIHPER